MNLGFTEEQEELRRSVRRFLADKSPESEVRRLMETEAGYDPAVWAQMASQLGLQALAIPEEYGGSGFSFVELVVVLEEMGRVLLCAPFFSSVVLGASALLSCGDESLKKELLPGVASGSTLVTLALTEDSGRWDAGGVELVATPSGSGGGWVLDGHKSFVLDGHLASRILVVARVRTSGAAGESGAAGGSGTGGGSDASGASGAGGVSLFVVEGSAPGLARAVQPTMDQTRKQARLVFSSVPARMVGTAGDGWPAVSRALDLAAVALAAEQVGGAQRVLDMSVEYAKVRVQFGRPIGSFQAVKHRCADMLMAVESAKSAAYYAAWTAASASAEGAEGAEELPVMASLAKAYCSEAYFRAAADNIQIHGGIGFTWDHPAHLYFKRAKSSELLFGDPAYHRELLAQRIGL
ncbi:MAG: acyl-CoA dehydrogenase family protein [Acidimicrobiales bacterium]